MRVEYVPGVMGLLRSKRTNGESSSSIPAALKDRENKKKSSSLFVYMEWDKLLLKGDKELSRNGNLFCRSGRLVSVSTLQVNFH